MNPIQRELAADAEVIDKVKQGWGRVRVWGWLKEHRNYLQGEKSVSAILTDIRFRNNIAVPLNQLGAVGKVPEAPAETKQSESHVCDTRVDRTSDTVSINAKYSPYQTEDEVREAYNLPVDEWDCTKFTVGSWNGIIKNAQKEIEKTTLNSLQCVFKKRVVQVALRDKLVSMFDAISDGAPRFPAIIRNYQSKLHLGVVGVMDLHVGAFSSIEEAAEKYSRRIAKELFWNALYDLRDQCKHLDIDRWLFPVGNDIIHCDNNFKTTAHGTPMDMDGYYHDAYRDALELICQGTEFLREVAPVDIIIVPGNHDENSAFTLGVATEMYFKKADDVLISNRGIKREAYRYYKNMLVLSHGDRESINTLGLTAPGEFSELWGETSCHEWLIGHWHKFAVQPQGSTVVRWLPSLKGSDVWHRDKGYVGPPRQAHMNCYDREKGWRSTFVYSVEKESRKAAISHY